MSPLLSLAVAAVLALAPTAQAGIQLTFAKPMGHGAGHGAFGFAWSSGCRPSQCRHETVLRRVWVPATRERVWVPPVRETRYDPCGRPFEVLVAPGHWELVCVPGRYELRRARACVGGFASCR